MRGALAGAMAAAATAALLVIEPRKRSKLARWAPGEARAATEDMLRNLRLDCRRTAIVTSLWAAQAKQCAIAPRYALTADRADFGGVLRFAAQAPVAEAPAAGARALISQLYAAGYASGEAVEAVVAAETPRSRAAA
ncbi:MAG: hypothetical protein ABUS57_16155 [Pseudomonadota bacterium]